MTAGDLLDAAAGRTWDALVIGAGPAGALAARSSPGAGRASCWWRRRRSRGARCAGPASMARALRAGSGGSPTGSARSTSASSRVTYRGRSHRGPAARRQGGLRGPVRRGPRRRGRRRGRGVPARDRRDGRAPSRRGPLRGASGSTAGAVGPGRGPRRPGGRRARPRLPGPVARVRDAGRAGVADRVPVASSTSSPRPTARDDLHGGGPRRLRRAGPGGGRPPERRRGVRPRLRPCGGRARRRRRRERARRGRASRGRRALADADWQGTRRR